MSDERLDLRIRYTRDLLRRSLLDLMKTTPVNEISISDLCRAAGINRGTFYRHYTTPFDLLSQVQEELFDKIHRSVERATSGDEVGPVLEELFRAIADNGDLCRIVLSDNGDKEFLARIMNIAHDRILVEWKRRFRSGDMARYHLGYVFIVGGSLAVIQDWIDSGFERTPRQMAQFIDSITARGLQGEFGAGKKE